MTLAECLKAGGVKWSDDLPLAGRCYVRRIAVESPVIMEHGLSIIGTAAEMNYDGRVERHRVGTEETPGDGLFGGPFGRHPIGAAAPLTLIGKITIGEVEIVLFVDPPVGVGRHFSIDEPGGAACMVNRIALFPFRNCLEHTGYKAFAHQVSNIKNAILLRREFLMKVSVQAVWRQILVAVILLPVALEIYR